MTETTPQSSLRTVQQFSKRNPAWTEAALRNLIFKADARESSRGTIPGNGLIECGAIVRIGRKVLIDEAPFFAWVRAQGQTTRSSPPRRVFELRKLGHRITTSWTWRVTEAGERHRVDLYVLEGKA